MTCPIHEVPLERITRRVGDMHGLRYVTTDVCPRCEAESAAPKRFLARVGVLALTILVLLAFGIFVSSHLP